jgi:hypothetical protein
MLPGEFDIVADVVVVVGVVVEFDSDGPGSPGANATAAAAPAMIRPDEQTAAKIFQVIDELRPGSAAVADPACEARSTPS